MINGRKLKVIGLAAFSLILLVVLFHTHNARVASLSKVQTAQNGGVNSKPPSSLSEGSLNKELKGKLSNIGGDGDEESAIKAIEDSKNAAKQDDSKPNDSLTQETTEGEEFDPAKELLEIRSMVPMVVFSKSYCPYSAKLKKLLKDNYQINPEFMVVELDKHANGAELQEYLAQVSGRRTVPNVLVGASSKSRGGNDDFVEYHNSGKLVEYLKEWGGKGMDVKKLEAPSNL